MVLLSLGAPRAVRAEDTPYDRGMEHLRKREYKLAVAAFEEGAAKGDAASIYGMGILYKGGIGKPKSPWVAYGFYRQAAELARAEHRRS